MASATWSGGCARLLGSRPCACWPTALALGEDERAALLAAARPVAVGADPRGPGNAPSRCVAGAADPAHRARDGAHGRCRTALQDDEVRLLTLTGSGGIGKTRLALRVAGGLVARFAEGVVFVPLAPVTDATFVPSAVAQALGVRNHGDRPIAERVVAAA